ncbi:hypothetical protein RCL_jg20571.t1 [Rhizophagus clarus]|uniref:Uncharacterized protein n=1 Tax=Rhizophagus clarus TaxID=94130 RepID=A0A8H3QMS3_9GLOM|nr:hypothetical protein RCL_jg20571.t1 [Rhizophagus clarus]
MYDLENQALTHGDSFTLNNDNNGNRNTIFSFVTSHYDASHGMHHYLILKLFITEKPLNTPLSQPFKAKKYYKQLVKLSNKLHLLWLKRLKLDVS